MKHKATPAQAHHGFRLLILASYKLSYTHPNPFTFRPFPNLSTLSTCLFTIIREFPVDSYVEKLIYITLFSITTYFAIFRHFISISASSLLKFSTDLSTLSTYFTLFFFTPLLHFPVLSFLYISHKSAVFHQNMHSYY